MPMEAAPLIRRLKLKRLPLSGVDARSGTLNDRPVVAITTGMGPALARQGLTALMDAMPVERVVVVGITGAVDNHTAIGTVIRPASVVDSATGNEYTPTAPGEGKLWTSDGLTTDLAEVARLRSLGVVALDMETAAIAEICEERGVPWSVIRVISDRASDGSVDEEVFRLSNQDGTPNWPAVARFFLRHPGRIPAMMRLARGAQLATSTAARLAIDSVS